MGVLTSLFLLISVAASEGANLQGEWVSPSITYWHQKLPTTAIPETLRELISADGDKVAVKVGKGGVSVNVGTPPRKAGTPAPKSKGKGVGMSVKRCVAGIVYAADAHMVTDPLLCMFLLETDLHSGTKVPLHLVPNAQKMHFLPRAVADEIPFSSDKLSVALKELNISKDSDMALAMKETLQVCERPALKGESKYCATSLESMIDYTTSKLGSNRVTVLATNVRKTSNSVTREYSITGVKYESRVEEKSMLYYCHSTGYAYAVYLCHDLQGSRAARVWVRGEDGSTVEAVAVCHTDTSTWNPHHVAFQVLNVKPGGASVCHFAPQGDVLWLAAA